MAIRAITDWESFAEFLIHGFMNSSSLPVGSISAVSLENGEKNGKLVN